jgi:hypothetical protein
MAMAQGLTVSHNALASLGISVINLLNSKQAENLGIFGNYKKGTGQWPQIK